MSEMVDILEIFENVLREARSLDIAESIFKCLLLDDPEVKAAYKEWCKEEGTTEKRGFMEYCDQRFDEEEECWDTLTNEYDE